MADFMESALRVVSVFKDNGLYTGELSDDQLLDQLRELSEAAAVETCEPTSIIPDISQFRGVFVAQFDDCNAYQDPGYYTNLLKEITAHSDNEVAFSETQEEWGEEGVLVSFIHGGKRTELQLDTQEEPDMVPAEFTDCVHSILTGYQGDRRYFPVMDSFGGYLYYFLPSKLVGELEQVRDAYEPPF